MARKMYRIGFANGFMRRKHIVTNELWWRIMFIQKFDEHPYYRPVYYYLLDYKLKPKGEEYKYSLICPPGITDPFED